MATLGSILIAFALVALWVLGAIGIAEGVRKTGIDAGWIWFLYPAYCGLWWALFAGPGRHHPRWFDWR